MVFTHLFQSPHANGIRQLEAKVKSEEEPEEEEQDSSNLGQSTSNLPVHYDLPFDPRTTPEDWDTDLRLLKHLGGLPPLAQTRRPQKRGSDEQVSGSLEPTRIHWAKLSLPNPCRTDDLPINLYGAQSSLLPSPLTRTFPSLTAVNIAPDVPRFNNDEYFLHLTDPQWSREETEYLMDLCRLYQLRFPVIHDRYDFKASNPVKRSIEDLQERYYHVTRKLAGLRSSRSLGPSAGTDPGMHDLCAYNREKETRRKKHLQMLLDRPQKELDEEEALFMELQLLKIHEAKNAKDREWLKRLLGIPAADRHASLPGKVLAGAASGLNATPGSLAPGASSSSGDQIANVESMSLASILLEDSDTDLYKPPPSYPAINAATPARRKSIKSSTIHKSQRSRKRDDKFIGGDRNILSTGTLATPSSSTRERAVPGASLSARKWPGYISVRTDKLSAASATATSTMKALGPKLAQILQQYGLPADRPIMPTERVAAAWERAYKAAIVLYEAETQMEKVKSDLEGYQELSGLTSPSSAASSSAIVASNHLHHETTPTPLKGALHIATPTPVKAEPSSFKRLAPTPIQTEAQPPKKKMKKLVKAAERMRPGSSSSSSAASLSSGSGRKGSEGSTGVSTVAAAAPGPPPPVPAVAGPAGALARPSLKSQARH